MGWESQAGDSIEQDDDDDRSAIPSPRSGITLRYIFPKASRCLAWIAGDAGVFGSDQLEAAGSAKCRRPVYTQTRRMACDSGWDCRHNGRRTLLVVLKIGPMSMLHPTKSFLIVGVWELPVDRIPGVVPYGLENSGGREGDTSVGPKSLLVKAGTTSFWRKRRG